MVTIQLENLQFTAHHGIYPEEKLLGNQFGVDVAVTYRPQQDIIRHLHETIDYEKIFALVNERMQKPTPLLETLASDIAHQIVNAFYKVSSVQVKITKLRPPIPGYEGNVSVSYTWSDAG